MIIIIFPSMGGGGNNLNLIRVPSLNEVENIIFTTDLNGTISPSDTNVWHWIVNYHRWSQNNVNGNSYVTGLQSGQGGIYKGLCLKNGLYDSAWGQIFVFSPIIEYNE